MCLRLSSFSKELSAVIVKYNSSVAPCVCIMSCYSPNKVSGNKRIINKFRSLKKWGSNIYTFQRDTQCCSTDCLMMHRCQLYMFRTVTVHPQELLFRCCMCRLWYVVRTALSDTSRGGTYQIVRFLRHTIVCTYSI